MAFVHSKNSRVFLNEDHQSANISGYTTRHARTFGTVTALTDSGYRAVPGLLSGSLAVRGMFDSAAGSLHEEYLACIGTDNSALWTICPDGTTLGNPAIIAVCDPQGYTVDAAVAEAVTVAIDAMPDDGVDIGVVLHDHAAETADGNGTSVDNAASSANGGVATLHVTAYSGLTDAVIKVQHSSDNSSWSDLITFTTVTGTTSERKTVTGTVNRYVRATVDVTGTGSVTYLVGVARR